MSALPKLTGVQWDGYAPHGAADWTAIRRLRADGAVVEVDGGTCCTCREPHDCAIFVLSALGIREMEVGHAAA